MSDLLPCPFCNSGAEMLTHPGFNVECQNDQCKVFAYTLTLESESDAIAAWNTRAESASSGRINGEIGLIANRQFGVSNNLDTNETLQIIEAKIIELKRQVLSSDQYGKDLVDFLTRLQAGEYTILRAAEIIQSEREELQRLRDAANDVLDAAADIGTNCKAFHHMLEALKSALQPREVEK